MTRRTIVVEDYDPAWAAGFERLTGLLAPVLADTAVAIEHVGSTSIPGLAAKPILDLIVVIESPAALPAAIEALATLGYIHQGERGVCGRHAFRAGPRETDPTIPQHHLYVCARDEPELQRMLVFRDYLRGCSEAVQTYAEVKRDLAARYPHDIESYVRGKAYFVEGILRAAREAEVPQGDAPAGAIGREIAGYYQKGEEADRLQRRTGVLEKERLVDLLRRHLPPPPATVLDVGGGPATHAGWLAREGWQVHLIDPVEELLDVARAVSAAQPETPIASITRGEARALAWDEASADAVMLFGPLYHLTERTSRVAALAEAARVVRPGGTVLAIGISRFASALDGLVRNFLEEPHFRRILARDLADGQHRSAAEIGRYFTTSYLHHPDELAAEARDAGLQVEQIVGIQGIGWLLGDFEERWADPERRQSLLRVVRDLESEPSLLGVSGHLLLVARRPGGTSS